MLTDYRRLTQTATKVARHVFANDNEAESRNRNGTVTLQPIFRILSHIRLPSCIRILRVYKTTISNTNRIIVIESIASRRFCATSMRRRFIEQRDTESRRFRLTPIASGHLHLGLGLRGEARQTHPFVPAIVREFRRD